ncbi:response regulator transcription factor [Paenibacillus glycanilyticus]|uniref:DNA-binding response regulator n=1 Tax=Paenibacillus glycanilyticus TaxID=126569 RepID=A0ABQ6GFL4_9BACL|nr:response regulator [Paenibacillus glycanilyticus]GLX68447.1 hypothetical protein MU1_27920 [Paenibacillus glycanilyticus]
MFRLLIVDDEAHIVDGLYEYFIKENRYDLDVLKAYTTSEAMDWLDEVKVDVVLSDVCMPIMNGLELVKEIETKWSRCKVVLLTGHNEFEYAHQAIRSPVVVDYLLKTEGMDRIKETVLRAIQLVRDELEISHQRVLLKEKMPKVIIGLQNQLLKDILNSSYGSARLEQAAFDALQMPFRMEKPILLAAITIEDWGKYEGDEDRRLMMYGIGNIAEELLGEKAVIRCTDIDHTSLVCFIQAADWYVSMKENEHHLLRFIHGTLETFQEACREYLNISVSVALSDSFVNWGRASKTLSRIQLALLQGPSAGMEKWMLVPLNNQEYSEMTDKERDYKKEAMQRIQMIFQALMQGDRLEADRHFKDFCGVYSEEGPEDPFDKMQILHVISSQLLMTIDTLDLKEHAESREDWLLFLRFDAQIAWMKALNRFQRWMNLIFERGFWESKLAGDELPMLANIHHYIHTHLEDDLSLTRIAEKVALNPSYLSRWYKKHTGESISDYIIRLKIVKAKELLSLSSMKIHDISSKLGFADPHYFFRFFKKTMKCTPTEYRELMSVKK